MARISLRFNDVDFGYQSSPEPVFQGLNLHFSPGWTGVAGVNGAGKSTLLRLACGELNPLAGSVARPAVVSRCPQRTDHPPRGLEEFMASTGREAQRLKAILGLKEDWPGRWDGLSHGERKRLQIGAALFKQPDVLAVDEPTNHLDSRARQALALALAEFSGIGLLVSHDRELLDGLCRAVVFVEPPAAVLRPGNYGEASAQARRERLERAREWDRAAAELNRMEALVSERKREAKRAKSRRSKKGLARKDSDGRARIDAALVSGRDGARGRMQRQLAGRVDQARKRLDGLGFDKSRPTGIEAVGETHQGDRLARLPAGSIALGPGRSLNHPGLLIRPGERIALVGPNGCGKSSLIRRLVAGLELPPERLIYLPQELDAETARNTLDAARRLNGADLGWVMNMVSRLGSRPERLLASRLPSPGESRKLLLALGLLGCPWLLILDEPTNHLDLDSIERLESALADTRAALLLASHDRRLVKALTHIRWEVKPKGKACRLEIH